MKKRLGIVLIGGMLVLAACGEEDKTQVKENEQEKVTVDAVENEATEKEKEEKTVKEDTTEEETKEETTEQSATDVAEATKGEASPLLAKGEMTSFVFNEVGSFAIYCEPHPVMKMDVIVEEGASMSGDVTLDIVDYAFSEEKMTVAPGNVITWTNQDSAQHNVAFE